MNRLAALFADDCQVRLPHVRADKLDLLRQFFADQGKEPCETLRRSLAADPEQASTLLFDLTGVRFTAPMSGGSV